MTAHDARPVAKICLGEVMWLTDHQPTTPTTVYTATDYDALRAEVERLQNPLSKAQHHAIREMARSVDTGEASILTAEWWQAICALFQEQDSIIRARGDLIEQATARAEAAEARVAKLNEAAKRARTMIDHHIHGEPGDTLETAFDALTAALNDQGQGNDD